MYRPEICRDWFKSSMKRKQKISTSDHLIEVSQSLFAEKGYTATTVQDIAKRAKVNVSLISYYFKGKEGLFKTCVERAATLRLEVARNILISPTSVEEFKIRLQMFTDEMLTYQVENPEVCTILTRDLHSEMALLGDIFERTLLKAFQTFVAFITISKERHFLAEWVDPLMTSSHFYGVIFHLAKNQEIATKYFGLELKNEAYRKSVREYLIKSTLEGVLK